MSDRDAGIRDIFSTFTRWTSSHGIPHIGRARHKAMVAFWVVVTFAATCLLIWQVVMLVLRYVRFDVTVGMETHTYSYAINKTICESRNMTDEYDCPSDAELDHLMEIYGFVGLRDTVALHAKASDVLVTIMAGYPAKVKQGLGIQRDELIRSCSFNTKDCYMDRDFVNTYDPKMGTCFTFNSAGAYVTTRAGPLYGLRIMFLTNTSEYMTLSGTAGVRVIIHNQTEQPFPDTYGYNVEIGTSTSMGVSYKRIVRLSQPYGNCLKTLPEVYLYPGSYTSEGCQRTCFQHEVEYKCGCSDPNYPGISASRTCSVYNEADRACWMDAAERASNEKQTVCDECSLPCEEGVYEVTMSAASWPAPTTFQVADCSDGDFPNQTCVQVYRNNGAMIEVFYEQLNYELLDEAPAYEFVNLASDFGGQLGLWLGLSALSIIEFIVLLIQVVVYCCKTRPPGASRRVAPTPPPTSSTIYHP